jgi:hypothetical protein
MMKATSISALLLALGSMCIPATGHEPFPRSEDIQIRIQSPLADERFVVGETVPFKATIGHGHADASQIVWTSETGVLGHGPELRVNNLAAGDHKITASVANQTQEVTVREFKDLSELYRAKPAPGEVERILKAFSFRWIDGQLPDEKWTAYDPPVFNPASYQPSKVPVVARLDVLRHQTFSEPLPFGDGLTVYDHVRKHVKILNMRLDCANDSGGGGNVNLDRFSSEWWNTYRDSCKVPSPPDQPPASYLFYIIVHEGRHSEPGEPGHTSCGNRGNMDPDLDHGSGHAWAALYTMWVYKYGLYDSEKVKAEAGRAAASLLASRFCSRPHSSNPKVQAIVDELLH